MSVSRSFLVTLAQDIPNGQSINQLRAGSFLLTKAGGIWQLFHVVLAHETKFLRKLDINGDDNFKKLLSDDLDLMILSQDQSKMSQLERMLDKLKKEKIK